MKLSHVIEFATQHEIFLDFMKNHNIEIDSAHQILAKITNINEKAVEHRIYIDFGNVGQSTSDVRIIIDYDRQKQNFNFIQIDNPVR